MLKLTYFILLIILSFYHLLEPLKKKTPTFLTFIGKKYLIKIMSGPVFSMPRRFWIFKAHPLLKKIKNVAPIDMKIRQKTLKNSNILGNFILFVELFLYLSTRQEGPSIHCKVLFSSSSSALEWSSKNQFCLEPEHAAPQESWSLAELPNWLAKLSHTDLLSDSWSRSSNSFEKSRSENIC